MTEGFHDLPDAGGEPDAPPAPDYEDAPEQALDEKLVTPEDWKKWPLWAKLRLLRRLRTEYPEPRPEQFIDMSLDWYLWAMFGGRGSGKSDEANRWGAEEGLRLDRVRFALVARTFGDVRDTIFEGETGLLAVIPDWALRGGSRDRAYNRSLGELFLANGSRYKGFSSEKPNQLRGPQHHRAILDEASSWDDADVPNLQTKRGLAPAVDTTMSNLLLGLRNKPRDGSGVRMVSSTTPKPNELTELIEQLSERRGVLRELSTFSNLSNLDEAVADVVIGMYEGTDVEEQELKGKRLSSVRGAAWDDATVAAARSGSAPAGALPDKVAVGVDPAVSSKDSSDETGLVAVGRLRVPAEVEGERDDHWVELLEDRSGKVPVSSFAASCVGLVEDVEADELLVEINNGYDFVVGAITAWLDAEGGSWTKRTRKDRSSVRTKNRVVVEYICSSPGGHAFVMKPVWQSVDKLTRAKAASAWWHRGRATHRGEFPVLEKQMTRFDGTQKKSPDRLDALTAAVAGLSVRPSARGRAGASPLDVAVGAPVAWPAPGASAHPLLSAAAVPAAGPYAGSLD